MESRHATQSRRSAGLLLDQYLSLGSSPGALHPISPLSRFRQHVTRQHKCLLPRARSESTAPRTDFPLSRIWDAQHALQRQSRSSGSEVHSASGSTQQQPEKVAPPRPHAKPIKPAIWTASAPVMPPNDMQSAIRLTHAARRIQRWWHRCGARKNDLQCWSQTTPRVEMPLFKAVLDETARPPAVSKPSQPQVVHHPGALVVVEQQQDAAEQHDPSGSSEFGAPSAEPFWVDAEWSELEEGRYVGRLNASNQTMDPEELMGKSTTQLLQLPQRRDQSLRQKPLLPLATEGMATQARTTDPIPEPDPDRSTMPQTSTLEPSLGVALKGPRRRRIKMNALQRRGGRSRRKQTAQTRRPLVAAIGSHEQASGVDQNDAQASTVSTDVEIVSIESDPLSGDHTYVVFSTPSIDASQAIVRPRNDLISIECALATSHSSQELEAFTRQPDPSRAFSMDSDQMERGASETSQMPSCLMGATQQLLDETERAQDQAQPCAAPHDQPFACKIHSVPSLQSLAGGYEPGLDGHDEAEEQEEALLAQGRDVVRAKQHEFLQVLQDFKQSFQRAEESSRSIHGQGPWAASTAAASGPEEEEEEQQQHMDRELQAMLREIRQLSMGMGMFPPANPRRAIGLGNHAD